MRKLAIKALTIAAVVAVAVLRAETGAGAGTRTAAAATGNVPIRHTFNPH